MSPRIEVYVEPATHHFLRDRLFEDSNGRLNGDDQNAPYVHLRDRLATRGIPVRTVDFLPTAEAPGVERIVFSLGGTQSLALEPRRDVTLAAFFAMECPVVEPSLFAALPRVARHYRHVYSWSDSPSLRHFTGADVPLRHFLWPQSFDDVHEDVWRREDRRHLVMINANKLPRVYWQELYTERMRAVAWFDEHSEIDLYGKGWDGPSMRVGRTWVPWTLRRPWLAAERAWRERFPGPLLAAARRAWRGPAASKREVLGRYDFALCFENCVLKGWITEKMFDCFFSGTIPVYRGAPDIAEHVPSECFVDMRGFDGYADLERFLRGLDANARRRYRERAREFIRSSRYAPFSRAAFTAHFERCVDEALNARTGVPRDAA